MAPSLARVVRLTADGSVIYRAEQPECRRFPGPASGDLRSGPKRNFQVFSALDFLAEVTQHTPERCPPILAICASGSTRGVRRSGEVSVLRHQREVPGGSVVRFLLWLRHPDVFAARSSVMVTGSARETSELPWGDVIGQTSVPERPHQIFRGFTVILSRTPLAPSTRPTV